MTICPRCGSNNETGRAACWNCYAPLEGTLATRIKPMTLAGHGGQIEVVPEAPEGEPPAEAPQKKRGLFGRK